MLSLCFFPADLSVECPAPRCLCWEPELPHQTLEKAGEGVGEDMTHQSPSPGLSLVPFFIHDIDWPFQMVTRVFFALLRFQVTLNEMTQVGRIASTAEWRVMLAGGHGGCQQSQGVLKQECTKVQAAGPLYGGVMSPLCQKYRQTRLCLSTVLEVT